MDVNPSLKRPVGEYFELDESLPSDRAEIDDKPNSTNSKIQTTTPDKQSFEFAKTSTGLDSTKTEEPSIHAFKLIHLNPGITRVNLVCAIIHSMLTVFSFVMIGQIQPLILLDEKYYHIAQDRAGSINSLVMVLQLLVKITVSIPYGHFADKFGRKQMIIYGAVNYLISCLLVPTQTTIFPGFVIAKIIFSNGASALHSVPLLADYIADESKGRASGIAAMLISLSAILANLVGKALLYAKISLGTCYVFIGIFLFVSIILNTFGLKGGDYYTNRANRTQNQAAPPLSVLKNLREALEVFKGNAWLRMSLVLQILGSSDFFIFFTFMTLYVKSLFPEEIDSNTANITVNNIQTIVFVSSFSCKLFYGFCLDKPGKVLPLSLSALSGGIVSFLLLSLSTGPYDWSIRIAAALMGATIPGLFVISSFLNIKNFPPEKRGIMIGFSGLVGYIGYFIISSGGGIIYDHWRKDGPFLISAALLGVAMVLVIKIYRDIVRERITSSWV